MLQPFSEVCMHSACCTVYIFGIHSGYLFIKHYNNNRTPSCAQQYTLTIIWSLYTNGFMKMEFLLEVHTLKLYIYSESCLMRSLFTLMHILYNIQLFVFVSHTPLPQLYQYIVLRIIILRALLLLPATSTTVVMYIILCTLR